MLLLVQGGLEYDEQTTIVLAPGERLLFYTDGAIEAVNPNGDRLEVAGLCRLAEEVVRQDPPDFVHRLEQVLRGHTGGDFHDDVALACIETFQ